MMEYKGFSIFRDLPLLFTVFFKICVYRVKIAQYPLGKILADLRCMHKQPSSAKVKEGQLLHLKKLYRLAGFLLVKVMRSTKPCLIRSLIVYEDAVKKGLPAEIRIGVDQEEGALTGHSWILIGGRPFIESGAELEKYTVMLGEPYEQ